MICRVANDSALNNFANKTIKAIKSTFSVIFYLKKAKVRKDGTSPIMGKITVDRTQSQLSCKISIEAGLWGAKGRRAIGKSVVSREVNRTLDKIRAGITRHYHSIMDGDNFVTAEKVRNAFQGIDSHSHTLMKLYEDLLDDYSRKVSCGMKSKATEQKYKAVYGHLCRFLQVRYHVSDISLREVPSSFMEDFEAYLHDRELWQNTVWLNSFPPRMLMHKAQEEDWISRYPFPNYVIEKEDVERGYLTQDEIRLLIEFPKMNYKRTLVRDLFLFCTFTGLAFIDMARLKEENVISNPLDGSLWIHTYRKMTGVEVNVKLLDIPHRIVEKYRGLCEDGRLFPVLPYDSCKDILRTVARKCSIEKHLTWHCFRHTTATVICLSNGMPLESVSRVLGHKCIRSTQVYAKIANEKQGCEMDSLSAKLSGLNKCVTASTF